MAVADELNLDVARLLDKLLDEHAVVAKTVARLVAATGETFKCLFVVMRHTQALAAATCAGLDHHRVTNAFGDLDGFLGRFDRIVHAGNAVHTGFARQLL